MINSSVIIHFDGNGRTYQPGETLAGEYLIDGPLPGDIKAIEVSILWYSEGKGDEDMAVHDFRRFSPDDGDPIHPAMPNRFETTLPNSPLSYDGAIVNIRWCVRVRAFLHYGKDVVGQKRFQLGDISAVEVSES